MPDITMCTNTTCPLKNKCYRATAKPNDLWQSYSDFAYTVSGNKTTCDHFWPEYKKEVK